MKQTDGWEGESQSAPAPSFVRNFCCSSDAILICFSFMPRSPTDLAGERSGKGNECKLSTSAVSDPPQIIDNILCFAKIDLVDSGTNLVLHILREIGHKEAT